MTLKEVSFFNARFLAEFRSSTILSTKFDNNSQYPECCLETAPWGKCLPYISLSLSNAVNFHYWHFNKTLSNLFCDCRKPRTANTSKRLLVSINIFFSKGFRLYLLGWHKVKSFAASPFIYPDTKRERRKLMIFRLRNVLIPNIKLLSSIDFPIHRKTFNIFSLAFPFYLIGGPQ